MSSVGGVNRNQHVTLDVNLTEIGPSDRDAALRGHKHHSVHLEFSGGYVHGKAVAQLVGWSSLIRGKREEWDRPYI